MESWKQAALALPRKATIKEIMLDRVSQLGLCLRPPTSLGPFHVIEACAGHLYLSLPQDADKPGRIMVRSVDGFLRIDHNLVDRHELTRWASTLHSPNQITTLLERTVLGS